MCDKEQATGKPRGFRISDDMFAYILGIAVCAFSEEPIESAEEMRSRLNSIHERAMAAVDTIAAKMEEEGYAVQSCSPDGQ